MDASDFVSKLFAGGGRDHHPQQPEELPSCIPTSGNDDDAGDPPVRSCIEELDRQMKVRCAALFWALATPFVLVFVTAASLLLAGFLRAFYSLGLACIIIVPLAWVQRRSQRRSYKSPNAGSYLNHKGAAGQRMARILARADLLRNDIYIAPPWYLGGDIATIATTTRTFIVEPCRRCARGGCGSLETACSRHTATLISLGRFVVIQELMKMFCRRIRLPLCDRHVLLDLFGLAEHREAKTREGAAALHPVLLALPGIASDSSFEPVQDLIFQ